VAYVAIRSDKGLFGFPRDSVSKTTLAIHSETWVCQQVKPGLSA
jgi:hypothetical protein